MSVTTYAGLSWPKPAQRELLHIFARQDPETARQAYAIWRKANPLEDLDLGSLALMPLLFLSLKRLAITEPALERLKGAYRHHFCQNHLQIRQGLGAIDALHAAGISVLALKGLALVDYYDGDVALRPMSDVDLLVPRDRAADAVAVLVRHGWRLPKGMHTCEVADWMRKAHGQGLRRDRTELDLHWASLLEDNAEGSDDRFWARSVRRSLCGRQVQVLAPTDLLFHGCVHGARWSRRSSILWVTDALRILEKSKDTLQWATLVEEARLRYLQLPLRETLRFLKEHMAAPVPVEVLDQLEPPKPAWLFWYDYHAMSADPRQTTSAHRAAAAIVGKLRRGQTVTGIALEP